MAQTAITYNRQIILVQSVSGEVIRVQIKYHHPYQVRQLRNAVQFAIHKGERLFGHYPYPSLEILEVPTGSAPIWSKPGQIAISEKQGWTADYRQPEKLDHIDYLVSREVFRQWLVHRIQPSHQPGEGFVRQSLADYLALDIISRQYGTDRLTQRLLQRKALYVRNRNRIHKPEVPVLKSTGNDALEYGRAALALNSIGQIWGSKPLSLTIAQFYRQAVQKPGSATASAFANTLANNLPDSLHYLTTYLSDQLWFDFKVGRIAALPDRMTISVFATKWRENTDGQRHYIPINDFVPLVVVDEQGREIYRQLAHPNPDKPEVSLPALPTARAVLIDPLGAWPELSRHDNNKLLKAATSL
ncbi:gluzincin family metallopeptidase [Spirosoma agri]|uniref:M1 family metallopeptidase n=1 Tax=Spirosoma agri TaxID=1987381 RepID=A0A6M0IN68_9BACT|nr:M1 family metallopeptidase [Spirosoma agri]NEU69362.1 M1 family metallopeptidase [Spirosoma agri]